MGMGIDFYDEDMGDYMRKMAYEKDGTQYDEEIDILYTYNLLKKPITRHTSKGNQYVVLEKELLHLLNALSNLSSNSLISFNKEKILVHQDDCQNVLNKARTFLNNPDWNFKIERTVEWQDDIDISSKLDKYECNTNKATELPF